MANRAERRRLMRETTEKKALIADYIVASAVRAFYS